MLVHTDSRCKCSTVGALLHAHPVQSGLCYPQLPMADSTLAWPVMVSAGRHIVCLYMPSLAFIFWCGLGCLSLL
jgi:hypothetical protein